MTDPRTLREAELLVRLEEAETLARQHAGTIRLLSSILLDGVLPGCDGVAPCKLDDPVRSAGAVLLLHRVLDQQPTSEV